MEFYELTQQLFNQHLLASDNTVRLVLNQYEKAIENIHSVGLVKRPLESREGTVRVFNKGQGKIGLIPVKGAMTYEESGWEALCGMTSYEGIQGKAEYLIKKEQVNEIILELNSGGGQAYGCFEAAQSVKKLADLNDVKITTYVDGVAYSGGYAWAVIADELIVNPLGRVGSIGVVLPLVNTSERDKQNGIKRIYITSGKSKVPFDEEGNYTTDFLKEAEKSSKIIYDEFVSHVAKNRGIDEETVLETEAKTFSANDALGLNLIDKIMTKEQFYEHIDNIYGEGVMTLQIQTEDLEIKTEKDKNLITNLSDQITTLKEEAKTFAETKTELEESIKTLNTKVETLNADVEIKDQEIEKLKQDIQALKDAETQAVYKQREDQIKALVPEDEVEGVMSIASDLSDDKFKIYVTTLQTKQNKSREEMKELGSQNNDSGNDQISISEKIAAKAKTIQGK